MNKSFRYKGSLDDLKQKMGSSSQGKNTDKILFHKNKSEYTVYANISWGTLNFSGGGGFSIKVHVTIEERFPEEQIVKIYTCLRPENYFFGFAFILSFIAALMSKSFLPTLIIVGTFALITLWFNFIYKVQEEILLEKITKQLKLRALKDKLKSDQSSSNKLHLIKKGNSVSNK